MMVIIAIILIRQLVEVSSCRACGALGAPCGAWVRLKGDQEYTAANKTLNDRA